MSENPVPDTPISEHPVSDDLAPGSPAAGGAGLPGPERARRAAEALAGAKADARARGEHGPVRDFAAERLPGGDPPASAPGGPGQRAPGPRQPGQRQPGPGRPGRGRQDDPQPLAAAIDGLLSDQGWRTDAAVGSVFGRWDQIVGTEVAAHTRPGGFTDGELLVIADSTAWATQVRLLAATLVRRLNTELGHGTVRKVKVRGPVPPRQSGAWRVRDGRGPRDDYG
jgi:predicted nucleic acid-binding Zn ribbon protein